MDYIVIYCTVPNKKEGRDIAKVLIKKKFAACVNIIDKLDSIFSWNGKMMEEREAMMIIKTKKDLFERVSHVIQEMHSYNVPEVIALPIVNADETYLKWIAHETLG